MAIFPWGRLKWGKPARLGPDRRAVSTELTRFRAPH